MVTRFFLGILLLAIFGCSSTKNVSKNNNVAENDLFHSTLEDYQLLEIKGDLRLEGLPNSQLLIRINKSDRIWMRTKSLGFETSRALFTKDTVILINRLTKEAIHGDYQSLSDYIGQTVNYELIESILLDKKVLPHFELVQTTQDKGLINYELRDSIFQLIHTYDTKKRWWVETQLASDHLAYGLEISYLDYKIFLEDVNYPYIRHYIIKKDNIKDTEFELVIQDIRILDEISTPIHIPDHYSILW